MLDVLLQDDREIFPAMIVSGCAHNAEAQGNFCFFNEIVDEPGIPESTVAISKGFNDHLIDQVFCTIRENDLLFFTGISCDRRQFLWHVIGELIMDLKS